MARYRILCNAASVPLLILALTHGAHAATITVSKTSDSQDGICDVDCSLREAISLANQSPGPDLILLPSGTYAQTLPDEGDPDPYTELPGEDANLRGDLDVLDDLKILGAGADATRIGRIEALTGARLQLENIRSGPITNRGDTLLTAVLVRGTAASFNYGTMAIWRSTFDGNLGWGEFEHPEEYGGALINSGTLTIRDSLFSNNQASGDEGEGLGGAIYNTGFANIARSTFINNRTGSGIRDCGSAICNAGSGKLVVTNSTFTGNRSNGTGAIANTATRTNLPGQPATELWHVTIVGNASDGVSNEGGSFSIRNSLIAANHNPGADMPTGNCSGRGFNVSGLLLGIGGQLSSCQASHYVEDAEVFQRVLYPLAQNGGITQTFALRRGSPAVDTGVGACHPNDQRGSNRLRDGDGDGVVNCDLGAYERPKP